LIFIIVETELLDIRIKNGRVSEIGQAGTGQASLGETSESARKG
jgi:hypothetical protein